MILFIDTESSSLFNDSLDVLDPSQPDMVQLGAQLFDLQGKKRGHLNVLIKPSGWEMVAEAEAVHGISTQSCHRYGVSVISALSLLQGMVGCATRIVGHNVQFDRKIITVAIHRAGGAGLWWQKVGGRMFCTMERSVDVLHLPGEFGFKFPTLEEAVTLLAPDAPKPSHDADSDIAATVAVYRALVEGGHVVQVAPFGVTI